MSEIFQYLNSKEAQNNMPNMKFSSNCDKYKDIDLCFSANLRVGLIDNLLPAYYPKSENIVEFYRLLGERIELALNLQKGKTNEELKQMLEGVKS